MRHIIATLVCLLASTTLAAAACDGLGEAACKAAPGCAWCVSAAVPAACYTDSDAARLPPGVFACDKKEERVAVVPQARLDVS
jgi:hypothetical protein